MTQRETWISRIATVQAENRIPIIAEIKASSPSSGDLLRNRSITDIALAYVAGGAACLSVVTGRWFDGNISMLSQVANVTSLPILRKDLIVNLDQIRQTQDYGANAILLTKKILRTSHLKKMIDFCHSLGITPFVEVASIEEINEVAEDSKTIIGVTNRDIAIRETDTNRGLKSLELIDGIKQKYGATISASGIHTQSEANLLYQSGFDGLLIGTSLLKANNPEEEVRMLSHKTKDRAINT